MYVMGQTTQSLGNRYATFTPSFRSMYKKNIYTWEMGAGLGWVVVASGGSVF
jgi:hypothetical protein